MKKSTLPVLAFSLLALGACDGTDAQREDLVEFADATFRVDGPSECVDAFSGSDLSQIADSQDWSQDDITSFCAELTDLAATYAEDSTLTVVSMAATAQLDSDPLETAWFLGATGYSIDEVRSWGEATASSLAVRACVREARQETRAGGTVAEGFAADCLEDTAGQAFPEPLFSEQRSSMGVDELDAHAAGTAIGLALYSIPGEGTVAAFLGGGFYAQAEPVYGAFMGCGAAIGFEAVSGEEAGSALCVMAEY